MKLLLVQLAQHDVGYLGRDNPLSPDYDANNYGGEYSEPKLGDSYEEPSGALQRKGSVRDLDSLKGFKPTLVPAAEEGDAMYAVGDATPNELITDEDYEMPSGNNEVAVNNPLYAQGAAGRTPIGGVQASRSNSRTSSLATGLRVSELAAAANSLYSMADDQNSGNALYEMGDGAAPAPRKTAWGSAGAHPAADANPEDMYSMADNWNVANNVGIPREDYLSINDESSAGSLYAMADSNANQ